LRHTGELLLLIPLSIPPLVLGLLLISVYGPYGFIGARLGQFSQMLVNSFWGLCLAQCYEAAPAYILAAQAGFLQVDHRLEQMSWLLGKNRWTTFRRITLPLAAPGLAAGFAFAVVRALGAFGAVLVIAYHPTSLPLAIWLGLEERGVPQALPVAAILLIVTVPFPLLATLWGYYAQRHAHLPPAAL
jgi:molybdate/tungstate transport system permease protein